MSSYTPLFTMYARTPPKFPSRTKDSQVQVIRSHCGGIQQGCNFGPLRHSTGNLEALRELRGPPQPFRSSSSQINSHLLLTMPPGDAHKIDAGADLR